MKPSPAANGWFRSLRVLAAMLRCIHMASTLLYGVWNYTPTDVPVLSRRRESRISCPDQQCQGIEFSPNTYPFYSRR